MFNKAQTLEFLKNNNIKIYNENCVKRSPIDIVQEVLNKFDAKSRVECENLSESHPVDEFICSVCGLITRDNTRYEFDEDTEDESCIEFSFKFCPRCGSKVIG